MRTIIYVGLSDTLRRWPWVQKYQPTVATLFEGPLPGGVEQAVPQMSVKTPVFLATTEETSSDIFCVDHYSVRRFTLLRPDPE